jgi:hypothetical protein
MLKYLGAFIPGRNEINEFRKTEESSLQPISVVIDYLHETLKHIEH